MSDVNYPRHRKRAFDPDTNLIVSVELAIEKDYYIVRGQRLSQELRGAHFYPVYLDGFVYKVHENKIDSLLGEAAKMGYPSFYPRSLPSRGTKV